MSEKKNNQNEFSNLFLDDSDDAQNEENTNNLVISKVNKQKILIATTGMSIVGNQISDELESNESNESNDNNIPDFIDESEKSDDSISDTIDSNKNNSPKIKNNKLVIKNKDKSFISNSEINGWDHDANKTIQNWFYLFREQSFVYQWVLDRNRRISDRLGTLSIISSSILGIFSAFKLWMDNDTLFQTVSNIILMFLNFGVALITSMSKRYIDNQKNETIRTYLEEVDNFWGEIAAQLLKSPIYRMNADKFFKLNNDKYTKLASCAPNLSLSDITEGKIKYQLYYANEPDIHV